MRKNLIKFLSIILSSVSILNTSFNSFAYTLDADGNSIEQIEYQNSEDENFSNTSNVFAEISNIYNITIPKTIVLNGQEKKASYYVKVEGDIAGYQVLNVVPDDFFYLYSINKDGAITSVYQDKTSWTYDEFNVLAEGTVLADFITAGKWKGTFNFNIFIDEERVAGDIILPDSLKNYKLVISKIEDLPGLYDIDGNLLVKYSTLETDLGLNEEIPNSTFSNVYPSNLSTSLGDIINTDYPEGVFLSLPESVDTIENNAFSNTNIKYVYLPESVQEIGDDVFPEDTICVNLPKKVKHIGRVNKNIPIYQKGYPVKELEIDFEDIKNMKEDDVLTLYKGYRYKIEALYNFNDDVTGQSTIKSSNENIVQYNPVYFLDAINTGTCFISGTYNTPSGKANAQIKLKVISDKNYTRHKHIKGETKKENIIDGTCSEKGSYDLVTYCKACGKKIEVKKIETDFKHDFKLVTSEKATCDKDSTELFECQNCKITKVTHANKMFGHTEGAKKVIAPTCTAQGYTQHTCKTCGQTYNDTYTNALGHTYNSAGSCTRCGNFDMNKLSPGLYSVTTSNGKKTYKRTYSWAQMVNNKWFTIDSNKKLVTVGANTTTGASPNKDKIKGFLVLPNGIENFDDSSLYYLEGLTGIYISKDCKNFRSPWKVCNISSIYLSPENKNLKLINGALYNADKTILYFVVKNKTGSFKIEDNCKTINTRALMYCDFSSVTIPSNVATIGASAFREMSNLTGLSIPKNAQIGDGITISCPKITKINIDSNSPYYTVLNNVIYSKDVTSFRLCPTGKSGTLTIPSTVKRVENSAADGCNKLTKIVIPNSVTFIGRWAFSNCSSVTSFTIPTNPEFTEINVGAFSSFAITTITIPKNIKVIHRNNFLNSKTTQVKFADTSHKWTMAVEENGAAWSGVPKSAFAVTNGTTNASYFKNGKFYKWTRQ